MVRPKSTHNPLYDIATHEKWSPVEKPLFSELCIKGNLNEETYLAAYLACWLCAFVLPGKDVNSIRPSTFKMPSMMASGRQVSLTIPVLASIYEGLNTIATSPRLARTDPSFPIHFVYAWLTCYFKTHYSIWQGLCGPKITRFSGEGDAKYYDTWEACRRIHKAEFFSWACNIIVKNKPFNPKSTKITLKRKKHEDKQVDGGENIPPYVLAPSIVVKCNLQAVAAETSKGKGEKFILNHKKEFLQNMWSDLVMKISNTPIDFISSIEDDVYLVLKSMKSFQKFDISKVEESLNVFFAKVAAYDETRSVSSEKLSQSLLEQQLKQAKDRFQDAQAKASEEASKVQCTMDKLEHIQKEIVELKEQRRSLCATLKGQKQLSHDTQAKVHEIEEDIAALENTTPLDDAIVEDLESSRGSLERASNLSSRIRALSSSVSPSCIAILNDEFVAQVERLPLPRKPVCREFAG
ncbi:UNVERIFIED_CONTAM: hypothetical protein Slati_3444300 [Sesamum latifolium]|uniref:Aminotransferase-like plant mobile domain-containing protein n=1 Tax=Sesamum latifolium TaxID=2727402 RepID=A0AAW2UFR9_9LAMI